MLFRDFYCNCDYKKKVSKRKDEKEGDIELTAATFSEVTKHHSNEKVLKSSNLLHTYYKLIPFIVAFTAQNNGTTKLSISLKNNLI